MMDPNFRVHGASDCIIGDMQPVSDSVVCISPLTLSCIITNFRCDWLSELLGLEMT